MNRINNGMRKFGWILGAILPETVRFSKVCDAVGGQTCHILRTFETASQPFVKGLNRGSGPAYRTFPRFALRFRRHFDPVYEFMT